jgi:hypothetical protein
METMKPRKTVPAPAHFHPLQDTEVSKMDPPNQSGRIGLSQTKLASAALRKKVFFLLYLLLILLLSLLLLLLLLSLLLKSLQ